MDSKSTNRKFFKILFTWIMVVITILPLFTLAQFNIQEFLQRSDTIQDQHKKASTLLFVAEYYLQDHPDSVITFANAALEIALDTDDSICICDAYKFLSISFAEKMDCSLSQEYFFIGLPYAVDAKDSARFYADMGVVYTICGKLKQAEQTFAIARNMYARIDDKRNLAGLITNIGVMHARNANYYQASECYMEALEISEALDDQEGVASIYQNLGEVMALQNQQDKAVGYYNSALMIFERLQQYSSMAGLYLNMGQAYIEQEQWDVAKHYLNKSYIIDTTYKLKNYESVALKLLGITYLRIDKLESAERLITEALRMQKEYGFVNDIAETTPILAEVYFEQGRYNEALGLLEIADTLSRQNSDDNLLANVLFLKSEILAKLELYDEAYHALKLSKIMKDSIFNIEKTKGIMNMELAYQTEIKEKQIDELKFNDSLRQEQLGKRTIQVYLLIVSVILVIVLAISLFLYWRRRQLNENQERERRFLQGRFEAEERAKDEIARELHDDIGGQLIGMILQLQSSQNLSESELKNLQNVYQDVRRLSHSLDEPLFSSVTIQEKVRNYLSELRESVSFQTQFIDDLTQDWNKIDGHQELQRNIYRIVQELITNTVKHARATMVDVQMLNEPNIFVLIYEDDGVGMSSETAENNVSFNTIRKRVEMFGGVCEIVSSPGEGIFVKVSIPFKLMNR